MNLTVKESVKKNSHVFTIASMSESMPVPVEKSHRVTLRNW